MSATISKTGTFTGIDDDGETVPAVEGQSVHEKSIGSGELGATVGMQTDQMGYQELIQFVALFAEANAIPGPAAVVRLRHMLELIEREPQMGERKFV